MRVPSGLKATEKTLSLCPRRALISFSVAASQMRAVSSSDAVTSQGRFHGANRPQPRSASIYSTSEKKILHGDGQFEAVKTDAQPRCHFRTGSKPSATPALLWLSRWPDQRYSFGRLACSEPWPTAPRQVGPPWRPDSVTTYAAPAEAVGNRLAPVRSSRMRHSW
jgi:hypothetical protein